MERSSKSYSLISGITNLGLELITISCRSTNGQVFWEYLKLLIEVLKNNYKDQVKRVILTCDGACYHLIDQVDQILKDNGMLMAQIIPYSPEFSPIELFINAVKSIIRKRIRMSKQVLVYLTLNIGHSELKLLLMQCQRSNKRSMKGFTNQLMTRWASS